LALSNLIACHECDLLNRIPHLPERGTACCARCGGVLLRAKPNSIDRSLALVFSGLILFVAANSFPFLGLKSAGLVQETTLATGAKLLYAQGMEGLATLVALTCLVVPALELSVLLYLLLPLKRNRVAWQAPRLFRLLGHLQPWGMLDVFTLGILVTLVKLGHTVHIVPGISLWAFGGLIAVLAALSVALDRHEVWERLGARTCRTT
jgi:paraquat-inducible protein A